MTITEINNVLVKYIEKNKVDFNINYMDSIIALRELLDEIENEYWGIEYDN